MCGQTAITELPHRSRQQARTAYTHHQARITKPAAHVTSTHITLAQRTAIAPPAHNSGHQHATQNTTPRSVRHTTPISPISGSEGSALEEFFSA